MRRSNPVASLPPGDQARIPIERRLQPDLPLSKDEELVVYRVAQEALTNVVRHAGASRAQLRGMRERAMLIGADFSIDSPDEGGTEVYLSIPATPESR